MIPLYEPRIKPKYEQAIIKQVRSGWIGPGETTNIFEQKLAQFTNSDYCVTFNSGTSALLAALNNGIPGEVLVPSYGYVAAANCAAFLNKYVHPVSVDKNGHMDYDALYKKLQTRNNVSAIVFIEHNAVRTSSYYDCYNLAKEHNIMFISDSAVALDKNCEYYGDCITFSFSIPKILTTGQGGAILTNKLTTYERLLRIRDQGNNWRHDRNHKHIGLNLRLTDIGSALGLAQLKDFDDISETRNKIWGWYEKYLNVNIERSLGWCAIIYISDINTRNALMRHLKSLEISCGQFYRALYHNDAFSHLDTIYNRCENAEILAKESIFLPSSLTLTEDTVKIICNEVNKIIEKDNS